MNISMNTMNPIKKYDEGLFNHELKTYLSILSDIKNLNIGTLSNNQIKNRSVQLANKAREGIPMDNLLVEAFALVCEASWRVLRIRPYDTQIVAGIALYHRKLVEMQTGEGKTLAAVMPAYLNALQGKGVHIFTFNDYLAKRDARWMEPIYTFLGLNTGFIQEGMGIDEKQAAYMADVTYVTAKEAGFDYLRDSLCYSKEILVHRPFNFVLVDEADSILIDEARVPLVIAEKTTDLEEDSIRMAEIVKSLEFETDYDTDEYKRNVHMTEAGLDKVEAILGCGNLYDTENLELLTALNCAIHAEVLLKRGIDYIVREGRVELIDEFTGRISDNRHWPDGLQAAVEAKEGMKFQSSGRILGTITLQHLLSLYPRICGMTATAQTSADEFRETYCLEVVSIPPSRACARVDYPDWVFTHKEAKYSALVGEVDRVHRTGRPILIGTASVEESELIADYLIKAGISCKVLNARNDEMEAEIIAKAGELGSVTVSTNMAGRGVDIRLGNGRREELEKVTGLGGLYVIGTNRYESVRVDNQLRGRAGRQGDPGSSRFFVSLEDDLITRFGIEGVIPSQYRSIKQSKPLEIAAINKSIAHIQRVINGQNFDIRKTLNKYSLILEQQRRIIYKRRREVLMGEMQLFLLCEKEPDLFDCLYKRFGRKVLERTERYITLNQIDGCWADYLDYIEYIKEGIHLVSISRKNPLDEFHKLVIKAFEDLFVKIENGIIGTFKAMDITKESFDLDKEGLKSPSATWTYIVNDNFWPDRVPIL